MMGAELDDVRHAVIELANATRAAEGEGAALVGGMLVLWEEVEFVGGDPLHSLHYAVPSDNGSPVMALGLLSGATALIVRDGLGIGADDADD